MSLPPRLASSVLALWAIAALPAGCGSRCPQVAAARDALVHRPAAPARERERDVRVVLPFARVNELLAASLREQPLAVPLAPPDLGPIQLAAPLALTAVARQVELRPGPPERVRFAARIEIRDDGAAGLRAPGSAAGTGASAAAAAVGGAAAAADDDASLTTLAIVAEVTPVVERRSGATELLIRISGDSVLSLQPELPADAEAALLRAVTRRLPAALRERMPQALRAAAARKLAGYLVGAAYQQLRRTLLSRLGERTGLRLRLPDVPIAATSVRSLEGMLAAPAAAPSSPSSSPASLAPAASPSSSPASPPLASPSLAAPSSTAGDAALLVELLTDLPVRRGLPALLASPPPAATAFTVELSPSASAELANWAIDQGHLPRWYTRGLSPSASGEFRPRFDHLADAAHAFKIYAFQERGGCSYFRVGVQAELAMEGDRLRVTAVDRQLEAAAATPLVEVAAWVKYFLFGSLDLSRRLAARTRLSIGGRGFESRVVGAALTSQELRFELQLAPAPPAPPAPRSAAAGPHRPR